MKHNRTDEQILLQALETLHDETEKMREKEAKKIWSEISLPFTLHAGLLRYTKDELHEIRKRLNIRNASSLKKADLVAVLEEHIPMLMKIILCQLDEHLFRSIQNMIHNGGFIFAPAMETYQIKFLQSLGFIFTGTYKGEKVLALPADLIEPLSSLEGDMKVRSILKRNTEWIRLTQGMLYYYGVIDSQTMLKKIEQYTKKPVRPIEFFNVMRQADDFYKVVCLEYQGLIHQRVFDPFKIKEEQDSRKDLDYYPFTKAQLLQAGAPDYVPENKITKSFRRFLLDNYRITRKETDQIIMECIFAIKVGESTNNLLEFMQTQVEIADFKTAEAMMNILIQLNNHTRQWILKGYMPSEIFKEEKEALHPLPLKKENNKPVTTRKIGRNDPCPCGSGKKYKKCCGR